MKHDDDTAALRERAQTLGLIDQAPVAVLVTDRQGIIASWNAAAEQLLGWTRSQVLGRAFNEVATPESADSIGETIGQACAGRALGGEFELRNADGRDVPVHLRAAPLLDKHGTRVGVVIAALKTREAARTKPKTGAEIGRRIAQARKEAGLTQQELAERLSVTRRSVQGYESGAVVPYRRLPALAEALSRPSAWFLSGTPATPSPGDEELRDSLRKLVHDELSNLSSETHSSAA